MTHATPQFKSFKNPLLVNLTIFGSAFLFYISTVVIRWAGREVKIGAAAEPLL